MILRFVKNNGNRYNGTYPTNQYYTSLPVPADGRHRKPVTRPSRNSDRVKGNKPFYPSKSNAPAVNTPLIPPPSSTNPVCASNIITNKHFIFFQNRWSHVTHPIKSGPSLPAVYVLKQLSRMFSPIVHDRIDKLQLASKASSRV